jgi:hypothetical protein
MPEQHLTSTAIDCSQYSDVSLRFWRWLGVEQPAYDHAYVRASTNGTTWTNVWSNPAQIADSEWVEQTIDLSAIADDQPTLYLRWTQGTSDGSWQFCGWNIDDVEVWALAPVTMPGDIGDMNCDGEITFADINPFVAVLTDPESYGESFSSCNIYLADINQDGVVDFADINGFVALVTGG